MRVDFFRMFAFALTVVGSLFMTDCATIVKGPNKPLTVDSEPRNAKYTITDESGLTVSEGRTPAAVTLPKSAGFFKAHSYKINLSKNGSGNRVYTLDPSLSPWYLGNLVIGGLPGMVVIDPITGGMWDYSTNHVAVNIDQS